MLVEHRENEMFEMRAVFNGHKYKREWNRYWGFLLHVKTWQQLTIISIVVENYFDQNNNKPHSILEWYLHCSIFEFLYALFCMKFSLCYHTYNKKPLGILWKTTINVIYKSKIIRFIHESCKIIRMKTCHKFLSKCQIDQNS